MKRIASALAAVFFVVTVPASADGLFHRGRVADVNQPVASAFNWTGFYLGGGLGYQVGDSELSYTGARSDGELTYCSSCGGGFADAVINGLSSRGVTGDIRLGGDVRLGDSPFLIGAFVGHQFGEAEFNASLTSGPYNLVSVNGSIDPNWYVGGRLGVISQDKTLFYVGYAYNWAELNGSVQLGSSPAQGKSWDINGHSFLGGIEHAFTPNLTLGLEYKFTAYGNTRLWDADCNKEGVTPAHLDVDSNVHAVMARLNFRPQAGLFGN